MKLKNLNIKYKLGLVEGMWVDINNPSLKIGVICNWPDKNTIYIFGRSENVREWVDVLIHEEMHAILYMLGLPVIDNVHHRIMHAMSEVWKNEIWIKKTR